MSDVETEVQPEETEQEETPAKKSKKHDLPDGWVTPSGLVHVLKERGITTRKGNEFKPQQIYGYCYNGKDFPTRKHTDGRYLVNVEDGVQWILNQQQSAADREAKAKAKAAAAAEDENTQPEVSGGEEEVVGEDEFE